jgi:transposase InsO family protein
MLPKNQGKIERYHRKIKNIVKHLNFYNPKHLIDAIQDFAKYNNHKRYQESLQNITPSYVYYGRQEKIQQKQLSINNSL